MTTLELQELVSILNSELSRWEDGYPHEQENIVIDDYAGGNVDDAYWTGVSVGKDSTAKKVLNFIEEHSG